MTILAEKNLIFLISYNISWSIFDVRSKAIFSTHWTIKQFVSRIKTNNTHTQDNTQSVWTKIWQPRNIIRKRRRNDWDKKFWSRRNSEKVFSDNLDTDRRECEKKTERRKLNFKVLAFEGGWGGGWWEGGKHDQKCSLACFIRTHTHRRNNFYWFQPFEWLKTIDWQSRKNYCKKFFIQNFPSFKLVNLGV